MDYLVLEFVKNKGQHYFLLIIDNAKKLLTQEQLFYYLENDGGSDIPLLSDEEIVFDR